MAGRSVPPALFAAMKPLRWLAALGLLLATATPALAQCPLSIAAAVNYGLGTSPRSVAVGDFNADGRPDLAVPNNNSNNVSVLLNTTLNFPAPTITQQPIAQAVLSGSMVMFTAAASSPAGAGPLSYQWRRNGVNLSDGGSISGATSATLTINPAALSDNGSAFDCVVSNTCGSVRSNPAGLAATLPPGPTRCNPVDIANDDGTPLPPFGNLTVNNGVTEGDYNLFFSIFFDGCSF